MEDEYMFTYRVAFTDGSTRLVRAESPKVAYEKASQFGAINWIKWLN